MNLVKILTILTVAFMLIILEGRITLATEGKVFQGTCISLDEAKGVLVLKNDKSERDKNPVDKNLEEITFMLTEATIGVKPTPGDKIRVGFIMQNNNFMAHKVMNITKQNIFKK